MSNYYITRRVECDEDAAKAIIDLRYDDLRSSGIESRQAKDFADSDYVEHVDKQLSELFRPKGCMLGVFAVRDCVGLNPEKLVGFADIHEWTRQDRNMFISGPEKLYNGIYINAGMNSYDPVKYGIHEILVDQESQDRQGVAKMLLDKALQLAESCEMYAVLSSSDVDVVTAVLKSSFAPTGENAMINKTNKLLYRQTEPVYEYANREVVKQLSNEARALAC